MLVRGRVEDDVGAVLREDLAHPDGVLAVGEDRGGAAEVAVVLELAPDLEQAVLGVLDQHEPLGADARDLAAELRADRAAGARHEHHLPAEVGADAIDLHAHRLAAEDVLDLHLAHLAQQVDAAREQLEDGGERPDRDAALAARGHDLLAQDARRRGNRDDHLVRLGPVEHARELRGQALHLDAAEPDPLLARVVVDESDRHAELRVAAELGGHELAAIAGADDQDLARPAAGQRSAERPLECRPEQEANAADEPERQEEVDGDDASRQVERDLRGDRVGDRDQRDAGRDDRFQDRLEVLRVHEPPEAVVEAEDGEDCDLADHDEPDRLGEEHLVAVRNRGIESQDVRHRVRDRDHAGVDGRLGSTAKSYGGLDAGSHLG